MNEIDTGLITHERRAPDGQHLTTRRRLFKILAGTALAAFVSRSVAGARNLATATLQRIRQIKLSERALKEPLPRGSWLQNYREFITRGGVWRGHPERVNQTVVVDGRVRAIGPDEPPMGDYFGFGKVSIPVGTSSFGCPSNNCEDQTVLGEDDGGTSGRCGTHWCGENDCGGLSGCDDDTCSDQTCGRNSCKKHTSGFANLGSEIESYWTHPFVDELARQFRVEEPIALARAINHFIGRNGYVIH